MSKFCSNCGAQMTPEDKFCPSCGTQLTSNTESDTKVNLSKENENIDETFAQSKPVSLDKSSSDQSLNDNSANSYTDNTTENAANNTNTNNNINFLAIGIPSDVDLSKISSTDITSLRSMLIKALIFELVCFFSGGLLNSMSNIDLPVIEAIVLILLLVYLGFNLFTCIYSINTQNSFINKFKEVKDFNFSKSISRVRTTYIFAIVITVLFYFILFAGAFAVGLWSGMTGSNVDQLAQNLVNEFLVAMVLFVFIALAFWGVKIGINIYLLVKWSSAKQTLDKYNQILMATNSKN